MELPIKKPDGDFIALPTEPTQEMLNAYDEARLATTMHTDVPGSGIVTTYNPHQSYWAMLNAAPRRGIRDVWAEGVAVERQRCIEILRRARYGEIDTDFRALISRVKSGAPANEE